MSVNLLAVSYAKRVLDTDSREQKRMEEFSKEVDRHIMVVFTREAEGRPREYHSGALSVYGTHSASSLGMLIDGYRLTKKILKENSDTTWVVSSQDPFETSIVGYFAAKAKNAVHHIQIHGDNFGNDNWLVSSPLNRLRYVFGLFVLRRARGVRVVSNRIKKSLIPLGVTGDKIAVLPVQVKLEQFLTVGKNRAYDEAPAIVRFLYAGRFSPEKRLPELIVAFAVLCQESPGYQLTLLGEGNQESELRGLVVDKGIEERVTFLPWTNDVPALMATHDVFVLNSAHEGYALVLLEAMAAGLALVTTDVGCVGELVLSGQHGVVLQSESGDELQESLRAVSIRDQRISFQRAGYAKAGEIHQAQSLYAHAWKESFLIGS